MAQIAPRLGDREWNFRLHLEQIRAARAADADLVVFPELSLTGYFLRDMVPDVAIRADGPEIEELLAAAGRTAVVVGFVEESPRHRFYNAALYAEGGRVVHVHRKVYLPTYGLFDEQRYFAAGDRIRAFDTAGFGRVGILICEDFWHLSAAAIMQAEEVDVLVVRGQLARPGRPGAENPHRRDLRPSRPNVCPTARRGGDRGESGGLRGRAVLLGRQQGDRARRPDHRRSPHARRGPDASPSSTRPNCGASG